MRAGEGEGEGVGRGGKGGEGGVREVGGRMEPIIFQYTARASS